MKRLILVLTAALCVMGCIEGLTEGNAKMGFTMISQEDAKRMMALDDGHVVVDVRRQDEYDAGHIPGAILIPNESIGSERPGLLPDPEQIILVYCRSGRRSKEAAKKLADMGYVNVYEFGGIIEWTGRVVKSGTEMLLKIGGTEVPVRWEENASVEALKELMPIEIEMSMYGGFEQVGYIGRQITRDDRQISTEPGDIVLYAGDQIVIFYGRNSWAYTRLGHMDLAPDEMAALLSRGDVTVGIYPAEE